MEYLVRVTLRAQERAPHAARALHVRSEAVVGAQTLLAHGPRSRGA
jgi:hypothetical protein